MFNFRFKLTSIFLALILMLSPTLTNIGFAKSIESVDISQFKVIEVNSLEEYMDTHNLNPRAVGAVTIFVLGIVVGYIIDGVIIYETGQSAGEWVADALYYFSRYKSRVKEIFCNSSTVQYITDVNNCVMSSDSNVWHCPYSI